MNYLPLAPPEEEWRLNDTAPSPWVMLTLAKVSRDALLLPTDLTETATWCTIYLWAMTTVLTRSWPNHWEGNERAEP